jgi:hypothetical protein
MPRSIALLFVASSVLLGAYKAEKAGAPPDELAPAVKQVLSQEGTKLVGDDGKAFVEVWFRNSVPPGNASSEQDQTITELPQGGLVGALRFPAEGADRRGQVVQAGVYTLRFGLHPVDGAHQGVAFQRDFFVMVPAAEDTDADATLDFNTLIAKSRKVSGTNHPAVLEAWKDDAPNAGPVEVFEGRDVALHAKVGDVPVVVILVGKTVH